MKLGSQTNSLTNHVLSRAVIGQPVPAIGMGVTLLGWTDRHPATIVWVSSPKPFPGSLIGVQDDDYERTDDRGLCESQDYKYSPNKNASIAYFGLDKAGKVWEQVSWNEKTRRYKLTRSYGIRIGEREKYHDFSF